MNSDFLFIKIFNFVCKFMYRTINSQSEHTKIIHMHLVLFLLHLFYLVKKISSVMAACSQIQLKQRLANPSTKMRVYAFYVLVKKKRISSFWHKTLFNIYSSLFCFRRCFSFTCMLSLLRFFLFRSIDSFNDVFGSKTHWIMTPALPLLLTILYGFQWIFHLFSN